LSSLCGAIRQQGYDLNFAEKEYFVDFRGELFGNGKKEIIVDYASIPTSTTPSSARGTGASVDVSSNSKHGHTIETQLLESATPLQW